MMWGPFGSAGVESLKRSVRLTVGLEIEQAVSSAEKAAKLADSLGYFTLMVIHYNGFEMVYKFSEIIGIPAYSKEASVRLSEDIP